MREPPGTERPRRWQPRLRYELIGCGLHGHELLGTDVAEVRPEDALVMRSDAQGLRWYRCLRCDSWLPLLPPERPERQHLPSRDEIDLPLRGKALRDKYVLRVIAVDRGIHFLVLAALTAGVLAFYLERHTLSGLWYRVLGDLQAGVGGTSPDLSSGFLARISGLFTISSTNLLLLGAVLAAYAVLEGTEAVGLWFGRRWAEYLTFVATTALLIPELYELVQRVSTLKVLTLVINLAVVVYLLFAKRLFGLRGGAAADLADRDKDSGWQAMERTLPSVEAEAGVLGPAPTGDAAGPAEGPVRA
jgi:uncharacterized membrane protein (DUF2068 family)